VNAAWWRIAILVALLAACSRDRDDIVARVGDESVTTAELEAYLSENLDDDWGTDALSAEELDSIRSRLFDAFLEERILLHEADRRGIEATDDEIDVFLSAGVGAAIEQAGDASGDVRTEPGDRETARRTIRVQKLIDEVVGEAKIIDDAEVDEWLRQLPGRDGSDADRIVLRSLLLASGEAAERGYREIRRRRMTFDEVVALHEQTPDQSAPTALAVGDLPHEVREAIEGLGDGEVSSPVELNGEFFLFQVVRHGDEDADARAKAERVEARRDLRERIYMETSQRLLAALRKQLAIEVRTDHLPFEYVPDPVVE
jgi:parvulin-like peptidyl-prolyl isomerase